ncbi:4241_t:CDS:2 [Funneliformis caledonium]|uniref:4241_t:CDS:1 n=1 Tax=Funneliformis caledonium TaxID=1117310 RepID=A0A9N9AXK4_9GLOM|nr:4241_t:CDS:2 [Funneliformis caledonium]
MAFGYYDFLYSIVSAVFHLIQYGGDIQVEHIEFNGNALVKDSEEERELQKLALSTFDAKDESEALKISGKAAEVS